MRAIGTTTMLGMLLLGTGCLREELPVPASRPEVLAQVCMGTGYADQVWFDIGTNSEVARNSKMVWDLALEGTAAGWQVRLNSSRVMRAVNTGQTDITLATDTAGYGPQWKIDSPGGHRDSVALGDWRGTGHVYAIDMGYNNMSLPIGVRKLQVLSVDEGGYVIRTARLNGTDVQEVAVPKDGQRRFVHYHIGTGQVVTVAPPDGAYDLVFTQYSYQFYDPNMLYRVVGALGGFSGIRTAELETTDFNAVSLDDTLVHPFSDRDDAVGYDWKVFVLENDEYVVFSDHVFIIEDSEGAMHKLHFTDFYGPTGQRGCPTFEVVSF